MENNEILNAIRLNAEDGLDPGDALTPEEALARILANLRGLQGMEVYQDDDIVGGPLVPCILRWSMGEHEFRDRLERAGYVSRWVVG